MANAITNAAKIGTQGPFATVKAQGFIRVDFDLDANGDANGQYAAFVATYVKGITGLENITVVSIPDKIITDGTNFRLAVWDRDTDILYILKEDFTADAASLALYLNVEMDVFAQ